MAKNKLDVRKVYMCVDRYPEEPPEIHYAAELAVAENPANAPLVLPGVDLRPLQLALLTGVKWSANRVLRIAFMDGTAPQKAEVRRQAEQWLPYVNLAFDWSATSGNADIRISFREVGAWSYLGTDCLTIPTTRPTMNFGFLQEGTALHEFGHALGFLHEHQSPGAGVIPWIPARVYAYYGGPPNSWSKAQVDANILSHYAKERTQFTAWDRGSIMEYPIDPQLVEDPAYAVGWNTVLSPTDKSYAASLYPKQLPPPPPVPPPPSARRVVSISFPPGETTVSVDGVPIVSRP